MYVFRLIGWRFWQSRLWRCLTAAFFILWLVLALLTTPFDRSDTLSALGLALRLGTVFPAFFALLSYEVFSDLRLSGLWECVRATTGLGRVYAAQTAVLLLLAAAAAVWFALFPSASAFYGGMPLTAELFCHILLAAFRDVFLTGVLGIALGLLASLWLRRITGYLVIALFILLTGPFGASLLQLPFYGTGEDVSFLYTLFLLGPQGLNWRMNYHYGCPLQPYRFAQIALWLGVFLLPVFLRLGQIVQRRRALYRVAAGVSAALIAVGAVGLLLPASRYDMSDTANSSLRADATYYRQNAPEREETAAFTVESYALSLRVRERLHAEAVLTLSGQPAQGEDWVFTLYHGFAVDAVADGAGRALPFVRAGDKLTVSNFDPAASGGQLCVHYTGFHPKFTSNSQGICLPGYIAYYPLPGSRCLFDRTARQTVPALLDRPAAFTVRVDSPRRVYCSLDEQEDGSFSGVSDGVTLLAGFVAETEIGGVSVIYPYTDTDQCRPYTLECDVRDLLRARKAAGDTAPLKKLLLMPYINNGAAERVVRYTDHISSIQLRTLAETLYGGEGEP